MKALPVRNDHRNQLFFWIRDVRGNVITILAHLKDCQVGKGAGLVCVALEGWMTTTFFKDPEYSNEETQRLPWLITFVIYSAPNSL